MQETKQNGTLDIILEGIKIINQIISTNKQQPHPTITETILAKIDEKITQLENRIQKKLTIVFLIGLGGIVLTFAIYTILIEYLNLSTIQATLSIGITLIGIGIISKYQIENQ